VFGFSDDGFKDLNDFFSAINFEETLNSFGQGAEAKIPVRYMEGGDAEIFGCFRPVFFDVKEVGKLPGGVAYPLTFKMSVDDGLVVGFSLIELAEGLQGMAEMKAGEGGVPGVGELGEEVFVEPDNVLRVFCFLKAVLNFLPVGIIFFGFGKEAVFIPILRGSWHREAAEEKQCQKIPGGEKANHGNRDWTDGHIESGTDARNWHVFL